ncbi:MAG TPA: SBBP repeat-containing protein [Kofleriaceae bacterium]|jgi:hypothetical protein
MRTWISAAVLLLAACSKDEPKKAAPLPPPPQVKKPVDKTPLPALSADPGGATGKPLWAIGFGGLGIDSPRDVALAPDGNIYVAGYFDGEIDLGPAGKHAAPVDQAALAKTAEKRPPSDAFIVKLDGDGKIGWGKTFGSGRDDVANAVAVHGNTVVVAGNFLDKLTIGEFSHAASGSDDLYVAAFDTNGEPQWLWTAGGIDSDGANTIAATPDGGWIVGGSFSASALFGPQTLVSKGGTDAMLVKLKATGDVEWVRQYGGAYNDTIQHVAVDPRGNIYIQGVFRDTADFGGKPLVAHGGSDNDVVLAKYDLNGDHVWSQGFGNMFNDVAGGIAVDAAGNVTMVGSFDKSVSFGPGDDHTSLGESDVFVTRFDTNGKLQWARTFGAEKEDIAQGVGVDAAGNTVTTGWFQGSADFGKGALTSKGNKDVFALKLDPKGATVWAESWGDHDHDQGRALAVDPKGGSIITGIYRFQLSLVGNPLESVRADGDRIPKPDVFVVKLDR